MTRTTGLINGMDDRIELISERSGIVTCRLYCHHRRNRNRLYLELDCKAPTNLNPVLAFASVSKELAAKIVTPEKCWKTVCLVTVNPTCSTNTGQSELTESKPI